MDQNGASLYDNMDWSPFDLEQQKGANAGHRTQGVDVEVEQREDWAAIAANGVQKYFPGTLDKAICFWTRRFRQVGKKKKYGCAS